MKRVEDSTCKACRPHSVCSSCCEEANDASEYKFKKEFLADYQSQACIGALQSEYQSNRNEIKREILSATDTWPPDSSLDTPPPKLTRSPSCPRLFSQQLSLSLSSASRQDPDQEPLVSPLTGMVANRKRVFETDY